MTPQELAGHIERIRTRRTPGLQLDVAVSGYSAADGSQIVELYRQAGATWWLESIHDIRGNVEATVKCIEAGPPKP
jgi:hypothetical protein